MRYQLLEGHDDVGGPFPVVVREGEEAPNWPGLRLSEVGGFDDMAEVFRAIEEYGLVPGRGSQTAAAVPTPQPAAP